MLNCVVVDDEAPAREVLEGYLRRLPDVSSVVQFGNAREAVRYLTENEAGVLFLDIEMPEMTGIDLLKALPQPPVTVFTTAYRDYAFEGFELGVIDFLLKPIAFPRFVLAMDKVRDFLSLRDQNTGILDRPPGEPGGMVFVKSGVQRLPLHFDQVLYIQGLKDYAIIHTDTGRIVLKGSVKAMQELFPPDRFLRVHKSFIVSVSRISRIERNRLIVNGNAVPVGRNYREELDRILPVLRKKTSSE
ncbi:LytR/AlgR family response regulator transcription factor [Larkinella soli]|uniref:LytR/AlgR family response regulator transcription factor n=1 Tax=Larkinella soli TaxID=1770527 RepID=UPI000FFC6141|nr:LytTR family DNA-binding domain-containing protein [Larkinella soli]